MTREAVPSRTKSRFEPPEPWTIWACPDCLRDRGPIAQYVYRSCECGSHKPQREVEVVPRVHAETLADDCVIDSDLGWPDCGCRGRAGCWCEPEDVKALRHPKETS